VTSPRPTTKWLAQATTASRKRNDGGEPSDARESEDVGEFFSRWPRRPRSPQAAILLDRSTEPRGGRPCQHHERNNTKAVREARLVSTALRDTVRDQARRSGVATE